MQNQHQKIEIDLSNKLLHRENLLLGSQYGMIPKIKVGESTPSPFHLLFLSQFKNFVIKIGAGSNEC